MRDYDLVVTGFGHYSTLAFRLRFQNCVHMSAESALPQGAWAESLDDRLIDYETGADLDGYVWGVKLQVLYPGFTLVKNSAEAAAWTKRIGFPVRQVTVETNGHNLSLIFTDLLIEPVTQGYSPFQLT
jgi:hypothetical protein